MIIVTGGAGFIGSALIWKLNQEGIHDIVVVDKFGSDDKWINLRKREFSEIISYDNIFHIDSAITDAKSHNKPIEAVVHLGACTDTTEKDVDFILKNNFEFSKELYGICEWRNIPFIYASSGATYGKSKQFHDDSFELEPLNPYGWSKHLFDKWMLQREKTINWYGLKFFNVYGPNEYHKGKMSSMIYQAYKQIKNTDEVKLFREGEQERDFVYVKDVVSIIYDLIKYKPKKDGIYNVGTGNSWTFNKMAKCVFDAMGREPKIKYIDMPKGIKEKYQSYTKADISKLRTFYKLPFTSLDKGISDYVKNYLMEEDKYL